MNSDIRYYSSDPEPGIAGRTSFAVDAKVEFWANLLCLIRSAYNSSCAAIVCIDEKTFEILETATPGQHPPCRRLQWSGELIAALRASPTGSKAVFHDQWLGLRLRYYDAWPTVFLVLDNDCQDDGACPDTTALYRIEKLTCDYLALNRKYRNLRRGFKCQGVALRQAQDALRKYWK
ncbi:hypothetical protein GRI62_04000 [Erythrobacter arachoides]|uniref:Uncharacterized protein n=1 Tax=Aurantiacibacter arachoides TaxID=1850444 RepID=A0A844ZWV6_9SPHN|nr:hypothetical protein [Aurantiacibacter arachoides]MXO92771.1 hypothetical protein [Aurantiacibacter arachoides]GGD54621.1 hypothetical protein GCM10011411_13190 [Aurantiacibacter arachoides]